MNKKQGRYSKLIIATVIILNVVFTAAIVYVFLKTSKEPKILTTCWFSWTTGELWLLSKIKKQKITKKDGKKDGDV